MTGVKRCFRAMNTDIELMCFAADAERRLQLAQRWAGAYEERYSRFRCLSELSRLNAAAGQPRRVSPGLFRLVELSLEMARDSGGLFDPTVLQPLLAAGYDRSFELIAPLANSGNESRAAGSWQDIALDAASRSVTLPEGAGIDLGGIGKGWAVDRLAKILGSPCLVNAGGDVFVGGRPEDGEAWRVGVENPFDQSEDLAVLMLRDHGVATSSSLRRRWRVGDAIFHHLIDPRTGYPSNSDAVQVTVVAESAWRADVHAKVALVTGAEEGRAYLNRTPGVEGLLVRNDGAVLESAGLKAYS